MRSGFCQGPKPGARHNVLKIIFDKWYKVVHFIFADTLKQADKNSF